MSKTFYKYEGDGIYVTGDYGLGLEISFEELKGNEGNEDYLIPYRTTKGSKVKVTLTDKASDDERVFEVEILKEGTLPECFPYDAIKVEEGQTYYGTEHSVFGSGNVKFVE